MKLIEKHKKAILVAFFFFIASKIKNSTSMSANRKFTKNDAKEALLRFAQKNKERAKLLEKMWKLETGDYKSKQYINTGTAGMEDGGWGKYLKKYFPNGYKTINYKDNHTLKPTNYIIWDNLDNYLQFLSDYIDRYNGDYLRWNSITDINARETYRRRIQSTKNEFVL